MRHLPLIAFVVVAALASQCTTGSQPPCTGSNSQVGVCDNFYSPGTSTIAVGDSITWTWRGSNSHSVTFTAGPAPVPNSPTQMSGAFTVTFTTAGVYSYDCAVHGAAMAGTVVVQ